MAATMQSPGGHEASTSKLTSASIAVHAVAALENCRECDEYRTASLAVRVSGVHVRRIDDTSCGEEYRQCDLGSALCRWRLGAAQQHSTHIMLEFQSRADEKFGHEWLNGCLCDENRLQDQNGTDLNTAQSCLKRIDVCALFLHPSGLTIADAGAESPVSLCKEVVA